MDDSWPAERRHSPATGGGNGGRPGRAASGHIAAGRMAAWRAADRMEVVSR